MIHNKNRSEEINAALREIYEEAEAEMEVYNQEILGEYLFENGVLQEDLDEWLAISTENYVASIEYVDKNYLCLSMNGDNFVAGGGMALIGVITMFLTAAVYYLPNGLH